MSVLRSSRVVSRVAAVSRQQVRFASVPNVVGHTLPTSVKSKPWLALKITVFGVLGLGIPPYAAYWHLQKSQGGG